MNGVMVKAARLEPLIGVGDVKRDLVEKVCEQDRRFFERYPDKAFFIRPYQPGEFYPATDDYGDELDARRWVVVRQSKAGVRTRCLLEGMTETQIAELDELWRSEGAPAG